jgi:hypothetical protein
VNAASLCVCVVPGQPKIQEEERRVPAEYRRCQKSYEEEDTCVSCEEEDTFVSGECLPNIDGARSHMRKRIHVCHMRRRIHLCQESVCRISTVPEVI